MEKDSIKNICLIALALCVAVLSWLLFRNQATERTSREHARIQVATGEGSGGAEAPVVKPQRIQLESTESGGSLVSEEAIQSETLQNILSLVDAEHLSISLDLLAPDGQLTEGFKRLFQLSPGTVQRLQSAVDATRIEVDRLTRAHATAAPLPSGGLRLQIEPFVAEGASLYDAFVNTLRKALGEDGYDALIRLESGGFEQAFDGFGAVRRTIEVHVKDIDGYAVYEILDRQESGTYSFGESTSSYRDWGKVRASLPALADLLPEEPPE